MWFNKKPQRFQSHYSQVYLMLDFSIFETIIVRRIWSITSTLKEKFSYVVDTAIFLIELISFTTQNSKLFSRTWIFVLFLQDATRISNKFTRSSKWNLSVWLLTALLDFVVSIDDLSNVQRSTAITTAFTALFIPAAYVTTRTQEIAF